MNIAHIWDELVALRRRSDPDWRPANAPTREKLQELRHALGFRIPDDILDAIGLFAGTVEAWSAPDQSEDEGEDDEDSDSRDEDYFDYGEVSFFDLEDMVSEYERRRSSCEGSEPPEIVVGPVRRRYFDKRWLFIGADMGGGVFAVDLSPARGGVRGQVIWILEDAWLVRVVAGSLVEFLAYGRDCVRYALGEIDAQPQPPFQPPQENAEPLLQEAECSRVVAVCREILRAGAGVRWPSRLWWTRMEGRVKFHKPPSLEQIRKTEQRMRTVFPAQLVCALRCMGQVDCAWLEACESGVYPVCLYLDPLTAGIEKTFREHLKQGYIVPRGLPDFPDFLRFPAYGTVGFSMQERITFVVVCSDRPHPLVGTVLVEQCSRNDELESLSLFADDVASFLEQGLAKLHDMRMRA